MASAAIPPFDISIYHPSDGKAKPTGRPNIPQQLPCLIFPGSHALCKSYGVVFDKNDPKLHKKLNLPSSLPKARNEAIECNTSLVKKEIKKLHVFRCKRASRKAK